MKQSLWRSLPCALLAAGLLVIAMTQTATAADPPIRLLFLGDNGHHRPADLASQIVPVLAERQIEIKYTDDPAVALQRKSLDEFDGLIVFANIDTIEDDQAKALIYSRFNKRMFTVSICLAVLAFCLIAY